VPAEEGAAPLRLRFANRRVELGRVHAALDGYLPRLGLSPRAAAATRLVVEELVANAISHAFPDGGTHEIELVVLLAAEEVFVEVSDNGEAFDPFASPPAPPSPSLAQSPLGGRGLALVHAVSSQRSYRREGGRNVVQVGVPLALR
jgi:anti-sigma regulatory factor (Ser/Thr protein kinase)